MVRQAAVAGQFYSSRGPSLRAEVERCFLSPIGPGKLPPHPHDGPRKIVGAMVPHAGLVYSGPVAAHAYCAIAKDGLPEVFVVIGPNHHGVGKGVATTDEDFDTPMGRVKVDKEIVSKLKGVVELDRSAHVYEHSIEVQLPFLQYLDPNISFVPIAMAFQDYDTAVELAKSVRKAAEGRDVMILASSDMSHYVTPHQAKVDDTKVLDKVLNLDAKGVYDAVRKYDVSMCGYGPTMAMILASEGKSAKLLKYANSGDVQAMDRVVAYASVAVYR